MTCMSRSGSARISGSLGGQGQFDRSSPLAETARTWRARRSRRAARMSTSALCHSACPDSILAMSSTWLTRRLSRSLSETTIRRNSCALTGLHVGRVEHQLGQGADRGQRCPQLVGHRGHEVVLQVIEALQLLVGGAQLDGRHLERARLVLERARVAAQLRGLVEDLDYVVDRKRLLLHDGGDHYPCRRATHGAGELPLDSIDQARIRDQVVGPRPRPSRARAPRTASGPARRRGVGSPAPRGPRAGRGRARRSAPDRPRRVPALEDVDEEQRLARLAGRRRTPERKADVEGHS